MAEKIKVELVTPKGVVLDKEVDEVIAPGVMGEFGVLIGHTPMLTFIRPGILSYLEKDKFVRFAVGPGFCEVLRNQVTVLVDQAFAVEQINSVEATNEVAQLEERLLAINSGENSEEYKETLNKIKLARAKLALTAEH